MKIWKTKQRQLQKADEAQTVLQQLELESVWVNVFDLEKELKVMQKDLEEALKAKVGVFSSIERWKEKQTQLREQIKFGCIFDIRAKLFMTLFHKELRLLTEQMRRIFTTQRSWRRTSCRLSMVTFRE